jgi:hypothetical protein
MLSVASTWDCKLLFNKSPPGEKEDLFDLCDPLGSAFRQRDNVSFVNITIHKDHDGLLLVTNKASKEYKKIFMLGGPPTAQPRQLGKDSRH